MIFILSSFFIYIWTNVSLAGSFLYMLLMYIIFIFHVRQNFFLKQMLCSRFFLIARVIFCESGYCLHYTCIKSHFYRRTLLTALRSSTPSLRNSSTIEGVKFNDKPLEEPPDVSSFDSSGIQSFDSVPGPKGIYALPFIGPLVHVKKFSKCND